MAAATTAANSSTFPQFKNLPLELRDQIWHDALPEKDKPALFPWKKGCWCPRRLQKSNEGWDPNDKLNLRLEFRHDLLDHVQVDIPLFSVNREARGIALAWIHKQNINIRFHKDKQSYVFTRPFDPMLDVLHIAIDKIDEFYIEPFNRMDEPGLYGQVVFVGPEIRRIAVPAALFQDNVSSLPELFDWYTVLEGLFVVVGPQPCWENYDMRQVQGQRWEVKRGQGRAFVYNRDHSRFDLCDGNGELIGDEALYRQIEEACKYLGQMATTNDSDSFSIRPVFAARR